MYKIMALSFTLLFVLGSCGDDYSGGNSVPQEKRDTLEGDYRALLLPVNPAVASGINGVANLSVRGNDLTANLHVEGAPAGNHPQVIRAGSTCPTLAQDTNANGVIETTEAQTVSGAVLLPIGEQTGTTYDSTFSSTLQTLPTDLTVEGKIVEIQNSDSLPIACGVLIRL